MNWFLNPPNGMAMRPAVERHQNVRRKKHAPKRRKRRNLVKFVPSADSDFAMTANNFAEYLARHAEACGVTPDDVAEVREAVDAFRSALTATLQQFERSSKNTWQKNEARKAAEKIVRKHANVIRSNPDVGDFHKFALRLKRTKRSASPKVRKCPAHPPLLHFIGSRDGVRGDLAQGSGSGAHILRFRAMEDRDPKDAGMVRKAKPDGAARIELYMDLIPVGEPVPTHPMERAQEGKGWPLYLRSFTTNPIEVEFPVPREPHLVVYWARWAGVTGDTGRFSRTCVARLEGWTANQIGSMTQTTEMVPGTEQPVTVEQPAGGQIEAKCVIMQMPHAETLIAGELPGPMRVLPAAEPGHDEKASSP